MARNVLPVRSPLKGIIMSFKGPPDAWATGITPAAYNVVL